MKTSFHCGSLTPHLLLLFTNMCFSGWHILGRIVIRQNADPLLFALVREGLASLFMYLACRFQGKKDYYCYHY